MQGWRSAQQVEFGSATSGGKGRERRGRRVGMAERGTVRKEFLCEWMKAGESRRAEAGLSCCSSRKGQGGQEAMWQAAAGRCGRLPACASTAGTGG